MPDATLAASYQAYNRCWSGRPDKAFTELNPKTWTV
ncbi:hypothetical protein HMPREF1622_00115, partial [Escherichia coli A35218R]